MSGYFCDLCGREVWATLKCDECGRMICPNCVNDKDYKVLCLDCDKKGKEERSFNSRGLR